MSVRAYLCMFSTGIRGTRTFKLNRFCYIQGSSNFVMTKGQSQLEENSNSEKASYLATRFAIEDFALKYRTSLQMAEQLVMNNLTVAPVSPRIRDDLEVRAAWSAAMECHNHRMKPDEEEDMEVESGLESRETTHESCDVKEGLSLKREVVTNPPHSSSRVGYRELPAYVPRITLKPRSAFPFPGRSFADMYKNRMEGHANLTAFNQHMWPYYRVAYPPYIIPMQMFNRGYPAQHPSEIYEPQTLPTGVRDLRCKSYHQRANFQSVGHPVVRPSEKQNGLRRDFREKKKLIIFPEGRALFTARRNVDNDDLATAKETYFQTKEESQASNDKDVPRRNSCRPSVLVMHSLSTNSSKSSPSEETLKTSEQSTERTDNHSDTSFEQHIRKDDHEATDSDSATTPPNSPCSSHSAASSDDQYSSDSTRSWDSSKGETKTQQQSDKQTR